MFKPSGVLTFTDVNGKPHLQILEDFFEWKARLERDIRKAALKEAAQKYSNGRNVIAD